MSYREMEGDTCRSCKHNRQTYKTCPTCNQILKHAVSMPYCFKNGFWIHEEQVGPCIYFERKQIIDLGTFIFKDDSGKLEKGD